MTGIIIGTIVFIAFFLSLIQFWANRGLWGDEAMLALNVIYRNGTELLKPLDHGQVAPILFLQIEKLFSLIFPNSEYGLRLYQLLCFVASILFFVKIIKAQSNSIYVIITALSLFAINRTFIYYSNEAKQYMSDVFVLLSIFYLTIKNHKSALGIMGIVAIFLSNVAPVILSSSALFLLYKHFIIERSKKIMPLLFIFGGWLSVFLLYYFLFIYDLSTKEFMMKFWSQQDLGFLTLNPLQTIFYLQMKKLLQITFAAIFSLDSFFYPLDNIYPWIIVLGLIILFVMGIANLICMKKTEIIILWITPIFLHIFISALKLYPYEKRFILYVIPGIILICSFGVQYFIQRMKLQKYSWLVIASVLFSSIFVVVVKFPIKGQEARDCMQYILDSNGKSKNNVFIATFMAPFKYYSDIGFLNNKINVINGYEVNHVLSDMEQSMLDGLEGKELIDKKTRLSWLKTLKGENWFLICPWSKFDNYLISTIDSLGYNRIDEYRTKGACVYLYDFGSNSFGCNIDFNTDKQLDN